MTFNPAPLLWTLLGVLLTACSASNDAPPAAVAAEPGGDGAGGEAQTPAGSPSADAGARADGSRDSDAALAMACDLQSVMARVENSCTAAGCHGATRQAGLDLLGDGLAARLVGVPAQGDGCEGEPLIDPQAPANSLLLRKIDPARFAATPTCGQMMPLGHVDGVSGPDLACFERWVTAAAATTAAPEPPTLADKWEDASVESALLKVKALTNGEPLTAEELASVRSDPAGLRGLVEDWASGPGFERKMRGFLMNALQQKATGGLLVDQADVLNFPVAIRRRLLSNLQESFVRTAYRIIDGGRPFREVLTTTKWEVTTALLVLMSYTEHDDRERRVRDHWVYGAVAPDGAPAMPPTLEESVASGFWYASDYPANCQPRNLTGHTLFDMLFGRVNCGVGRAYQPASPLIGDSDYDDWREVEFIATTGKGSRRPFWDLPALRTAVALDVRLPRVGFFTTPAFLDNWPTNGDNQFRVTASQTMIAALGQEFSTGDTTQPLTLVGLAAEHAQPATACYACHVHLDPMRNFFVGHFDADYQVRANPVMEEAGFAFRGHASEGGSIYDFADEIAHHPLFAEAWAQKLCQYANSQACDPNDPAFEAVVDAFVASDLDFRTLVVELFSSPLVTGLQYSATYASREWLVSITRQDHLCPRLDRHLGLDDVCGEGAAFIGLFPEDEFARGQAAPVQTAVTSAFHAAAAEALCGRLSLRLVGNRAEQPFQAAEAEVSLARMVDALLGLPEGHSRRALWVERLGAHYQEARGMGATRGVALRSAFTLACTSPEVMALGL